MRKIRLTTTLVAVGLTMAACGNASPSSAPPTTSGRPAGDHPIPSTHEIAREYAGSLLAAVQVPAGSTTAVRAPSKALEGLPERPMLSKPPTVVTKYWTVDRKAPEVYAWLKQHRPGAGLADDGSSASTPPAQAAQYLSYRVASLPGSIGAAYVYVGVVSTGPASSALAAWAVTLAQPPRPAVERVPLSARAVIGWSLAVGGTPVRKILTGAAAAKLAHDFDQLRVDVAGKVFCPMTPQRYADIVVTFTARGDTWKVKIPACPDIGVTRDGHSLPGLSFGNPFLADVKSYTGHLPEQGPPQRKGSVIPLVQSPTPR